MRFWYDTSLRWQARLLWPLSLLTAAVVRRRFLKRHTGDYSAPVLVVGNITVGGTGKSPAIQALVRALGEKGLSCGIVSRGYGGRARHYPLLVTADTSAAESGDEPLMLARSLGCPVVVDPDRDQAVRHLLASHPVDLVVSDDGLQHYTMGRDFELVMVDGQRGLGNRCLLPAGPLREAPERLNTVDWLVAKGQTPDGIVADGVLTLNPTLPVNSQDQVLSLGTEVDVCAGIGHPSAFLAQIRDQGFRVKTFVAPGDHQAVPANLVSKAERPLVITEKDAVKLPFPWPDHVYMARLDPQLPQALIDTIESAIRGLSRG